MARTAIAVITAVHTGVGVSFTASDQVNANSFVNDGNSVLMVRNTGASPVVLTIRTTRVEDGDLKLPDRIVTVPVSTAGTPAVILGKFSQDIYNQADGTIWVDCAASLQLAVLSVS